MQKNKKKIQKKFLISEITPYENIAINSLFYEENTCHWQSMGQQRVPRFCNPNCVHRDQ